MAVHVTKHNGGWQVKTGGAGKAYRVVKTQEEAIKIANEVAKNQKTDVKIHGKNGRIRACENFTKAKKSTVKTVEENNVKNVSVEENKNSTMVKQTKANVQTESLETKPQLSKKEQRKQEKLAKQEAKQQQKLAKQEAKKQAKLERKNKK